MSIIHDDVQVDSYGESFIGSPAPFPHEPVKTGISKRKPAFLENRSYDDTFNIQYEKTQRGLLMHHEGHTFLRYGTTYGPKIYWRCIEWKNHCKARAVTNDKTCLVKGFQINFINSKKNGGKLLVINGFRFFRNKRRGTRQYWKCSNYYKEKCPAIAIYEEETLNLRLCHQHRHTQSNDIDIKPFLTPRILPVIANTSSGIDIKVAASDNDILASTFKSGE